MALTAQYQCFLANPSTDQLAEGASINYIATLTSIHEPTPIVKHLSAQAKLLEKKSEKVLSAVEGADALCAEVETTLEFKIGGGAYLPGLDENFLADRIVTFPVVHIVSFRDQKISQIRLHWDQGSLLKQVDVIGSRAKNWPIREGKDQVRLIANTSTSQPSEEPSTASSRRSTTTSRTSDTGSAVSATKDPHASLDLFKPRDVNVEEPRITSPSAAPRASAIKPPSRGLAEILSGDDPSTPARGRSPGKGGAGKHFTPIRLFDENNSQDANRSPERTIKTNPKKYNHFEFGNGEDAEAAKPKINAADKKTKHTTSWDFEDFVTPAKPTTKMHPQEERHFGWSGDEDASHSPVRRPVVHASRRDADAHFEFADEATSANKKKQPSIIARNPQALRLYADPVHDEETPEGKKPLQNAKNMNTKAHGKTFNSHFDMTDAQDEHNGASDGNNKGNGHVPGKKQTQLDTHWDTYDVSPSGKKENVPLNGSKSIHIEGDGMGSRKGPRQWGIGDESDDEAPALRHEQKRQQPVRNTGDKSWWDF